MRPIVLIVATLLILPLAPARASEAADVPSWLAHLLEAQGVRPEDWSHVQVERRVLEAGAWRVEPATLAEVGEPPRAAGAPTPDAVVGHLALHAMIQIGRCDGYEIEPLADGLSKVGGSWNVGIHVASVASGGVDTADPQASHTGAATHADVSVAGAGDVSIQETRITIFGICLALLGTMSGDGVFAFDQTWPA